VLICSVLCWLASIVTTAKPVGAGAAALACRHDLTMNTRPPRRPSKSPGATERGSATTAARTMQFIVLEQGFGVPR
jgi:hypothetical protein